MFYPYVAIYRWKRLKKRIIANMVFSRGDKSWKFHGEHELAEENSL